MADDSTPHTVDSVAGEWHRPTVPMRSLTVRQPWAWAIMHGGKTVENRSWSTDLGTVAIVAGLKSDATAAYSKPLQRAWEVLGEGPYGVPGWWNHPRLPLGAIVGLVDIVDVHLSDSHRGCFREADVLGWMPFDGSDASEPGWEPRLCSEWAIVPERDPVSGSGRMRHFVLENARPLEHPVKFRGHQSIRPLEPRVVRTVEARLESQRG